MKNKFERFKEEIEKEYCKIVERIDNTAYCEFYERERRESY